MKSLYALGLISVSLYQLISYLIARRRFNLLPTTSGSIIESSLTDHSDIEGRRVYEANISFKYSVNGVEYKSETPALKSVQIFPNFTYESDLVAEYSSGDNVSVRYFPESPNIAYIKVAPLSILSTIAVVAGSLVGLAGLVYLWISGV